MNNFQRICLKTGKSYDRGYNDAGHPKDELVIYKYNKETSLANVRDTRSRKPYFFQLHELLPFDSIDGFDPKLKPLTVIEAKKIERTIFPNGEASVYLADSTRRGGTYSLKDPDAIVMLYRLKELGYDSFVLATTGDCGASVCHYGSMLGIDIHLFVPENCNSRWRLLEEEMKQEGLIDDNRVKVYVRGSNMHEAFDASVAFAHENCIPHDYFFNNQLRVEGSKTMHIELVERLGKMPDYYIQALGSGTGLFSMWKASFDLGMACPQLVGVQPAGCAPMARAAKGFEVQKYANTYVMGIGLPKLGPAFPYLQELGTWFVEVHNGSRDDQKKDMEKQRREKEKAGIKKAIAILRDEGIPNPGLEASLTVTALEQTANIIKERSSKESRTLCVVLGITGRLREGDRRALDFD